MNGQPNDLQLDLAARLGFMMQVLFQIPRNGFGVALRLWPAIRLNQIEILFDKRGIVQGYAVWAFLSDEVSARFAADSSLTFHLSDWNEGCNLWLIDFVALNEEGCRALARRLRQTSFRRFERLRAIRQKPGRKPRLIDIALHVASSEPDLGASGEEQGDERMRPTCRSMEVPAR